MPTAGLRRAVLALLVLGLLTGAGAASAAAAAPLHAHGSAEQVYVTGLRGGERMSLVDRTGRTIAVRRADPLGGLLFRDVPPGRGYRVRRYPHGARSRPVTVFSDRPAPPSRSVYDQSIPGGGYGYLTTRDGTRLAIDVRPPAAPGPWPTLIEYSGYGYADPAGPVNGIAVLANLMGFAVVDVNMRGTGCSGGAFDFFEPLQNLDGYDVIETVARQPWVRGHRVGMMGISYGGISQLFTAQTDPPHLAAISPLSVLDGMPATLYPGGILNTGFAVAWARQRARDAEPAGPHGGQAWAYERIRQGDAICRANQVLHGEAVSVAAQIRAGRHYVPSIDDPLSPVTFVRRIHVPTFLACQWTDEQTGGHCPALAERFTGTRRKWLTFTNGTHIDSLDPETFDRWYDFLELFVAHQAPIVNAAAVHAVAPAIYRRAMGIAGVGLPPDPVQLEPTYAGALAAFERQPPVRVLFDNGAGFFPGYPYAGFARSFARFPIPGTAARSWYLAPRGKLAGHPPARPSATRFTWNPRALPATDFSGPTDGSAGGLWTAAPAYRWAQAPPGTAVSYLTAPLRSTTTVIGAGALRLWLRSSAPNVDLQATVSEVRPDGLETFVQNGWVRGDERALDARRSTLLEPVLSLRAADVSPLPRRRFAKVTIPLYYEGHVYRAGSRIRVTISAPGGSQPIWSFGRAEPRGTATVAIAASRAMPSRLILPVVPHVRVPTGLPPCPGLRGEPCRRYVRIVNRTATP